MARETVFVDFKPGDTSELTATVNTLTSKEKKAYEDGNKELEKRKSELVEISKETTEVLKTAKESTEETRRHNAEHKKTAGFLKDIKELHEGVNAKAREAMKIADQQAAAAKGLNAEMLKGVSIDATVIQKAAEGLKVQQDKIKAANDLKNAQVQNVIELGNELKVQKSVNDAMQKGFLSAKTVGDQIIALGEVFSAAFESGGNEGLQDVFDSLQAGIKDTGLTVEQFIEQLKQADPSTSLVAESTTKLKAELSSVKNEMAELITSGQRNSQQYADLKEKAVALSEAQQRVNASIKGGTKSTEVISGVTDSVDALNAGFQIAVGATAVFGETNEDLAKTMQYLNGVMVLTNGIQQATTILKNKDNVVTKALIVTQNAFTTALFGTTTGLTALQTALAATGVGALVIALGLAVAKLAEYVSKLHDATDAQKGFSDAMAGITNDLALANAALEVNSKVAIENAKRQKDSFEDVFDIQQKTLNRRLQNQKTFTNAMRAEENDLARAISDLQSGRENELAKHYKNNFKALNADLQTTRKAREDSANKETELQNKFLEDAATHQTEQYKRNIEALKKFQNESNEIYNRTAAYQIEVQDTITNDTTKQYQTRISALENSNKLRLNFIEKQRQQELEIAAKDATTTNETLLNINDKFNTERDRVYNDYQEKRKALVKAQEKELAETQSQIQINAIQMRLATVERGTRRELDLGNDLLRAQAEQQKKQVEISVTNEQLKAAQIEAINLELNARLMANNEAYEKERLRHATDVERQIHDLAIAQSQLKIVGKDPNSADVFKQQQDARQKYLQESLDEMARLQYAFDTGRIKDKEQFEKDYNDLEIKAANQRVDILQAEAERRKKINDTIKEQAFNIAQDLSDAIFSANDEKRKAQLDEQQEQLDKARENELNNENLTEQQKEQVNERYDAKERQLKRRAAEQDKQASISQAIINGALAVTKAFASLVWPFNLIQAAAVAAATGIQIAKIKSTPLPAYATGTKNAKKGSAIAGELGRELVYMQGGEIVLTHKETEKVLQYAGTKEMIQKTAREVITDRFKERAVTLNNVVNRDYHSVTNTAKFDSIDYRKLGTEIGKQFELHGTRIETNFDADGMGQWISKSGNKTKYLNKRYSL